MTSPHITLYWEHFLTALRLKLFNGYVLLIIYLAILFFFFHSPIFYQGNLAVFKISLNICPAFWLQTWSCYGVSCLPFTLRGTPQLNIWDRDKVEHLEKTKSKPQSHWGGSGKEFLFVPAAHAGPWLEGCLVSPAWVVDMPILLGGILGHELVERVRQSSVHILQRPRVDSVILRKSFHCSICKAVKWTLCWSGWNPKP